MSPPEKKKLYIYTYIMDSLRGKDATRQARKYMEKRAEGVRHPKRTPNCSLSLSLSRVIEALAAEGF